MRIRKLEVVLGLVGLMAGVTGPGCQSCRGLNGNPFCGSGKACHDNSCTHEYWYINPQSIRVHPYGEAPHAAASSYQAPAAGEMPPESPSFPAPPDQEPSSNSDDLVAPPPPMTSSVGHSVPQNQAYREMLRSSLGAVGPMNEQASFGKTANQVNVFQRMGQGFRGIFDSTRGAVAQPEIANPQTTVSGAEVHAGAYDRDVKRIPLPQTTSEQAGFDAYGPVPSRVAAQPQSGAIPVSAQAEIATVPDAETAASEPRISPSIEMLPPQPAGFSSKKSAATLPTPGSPAPLPATLSTIWSSESPTNSTGVELWPYRPKN